MWICNTDRQINTYILCFLYKIVGKSALSSLIAERLRMRLISVGDLVKQHSLHEGMCAEFDSLILDEDKLLDLMEPMMYVFEEGNDGYGVVDLNDNGDDSDSAADDDDGDLSRGKNGIVVDYHSCDFFPERWFDLVLVLRADTDVLFDRLVKRGYSEKKRDENMECEIMQVVLGEAKESYAAEIVYEVPSNTLEDLESNVTRVHDWCTHWLKDNST